MISEVERPTSFSWRLISFEHNSYRWPETFRREDVQRQCPKPTSLGVTTLCQGCCACPCLDLAMCTHVETEKLLSSLIFKEGTVSLSENPASQKLKYPKWLATCILWWQSLSHVIKIMTLQKEKSGKNFIFITYLVIIFSLLSRQTSRPGTDEIVERTSHQFCQLLSCRPWGSCDSFFLLESQYFHYQITFSSTNSTGHAVFPLPSKWAKNVNVHIANLTKQY